MSTLFNYWHYLVIIIIMLTLLAGILYAFKQKERSLIFPIIFSTTIISAVLGWIGIVVVDKYTKVAKLYRLENKRNLSTEEIMYSGIVKNEGDYEIGEVVFEIKIVNGGSDVGSIRSGVFFKPSGFSDLFSSGAKPQQIIHEFVVARNLRPGKSQEFRVYFDYPPYFRSVSHFSKVYAH